MSEPELERVLTAAQTQAASRLELMAAVTAARSAGCTWAQLGTVLGMSRQAVFKRFGRDELETPADTSRTVADLELRARRLFEDLDHDRIDQVRATMPAPVAAVLTADTLRTTWASATSARGAFLCSELLAVEHGSISTVEPRDLVSCPAVVSLALHHEHGDWHGRVSYDGSDRVLGMLVIVPGAPAPF